YLNHHSLPPLPATPIPKTSYPQHLSHPSTLQPKPTPHVNPTQPPKPLSSQPKPKSQSGELERSSAFFRIDSKAFSLAFDGGRIDSYAIHERQGQFHGSIRVGRLGLDWIIACFADLYHWNFQKQHFFKSLRENSKLLEITSRSNKGGIFVEIFEYHHGARWGCPRVPEGTKIGGWALFGMRLRDHFLGNTTYGLEKKVVDGGDEFEKTVDMQKSQVWKKLKVHEIKGSDLRFVKQFPNITNQIHKSESLGGFDFTKKSSKASVSTTGKSVRLSHLKWTQAHLNLKISVDLVGEGKRAVSWGKTQPNVSGTSQAQAQHTTTR
ncbi:hypothetical protein CMV_027413, partial [Castanea mollissima]